MPCNLVWRLDTWQIRSYMTGKSFRDRVRKLKYLGKVGSVKASILGKVTERRKEILNFEKLSDHFTAKFPHSTVVS